ncbi:MAG: HAD family hydrolase [Acidimicrobiales bacterium]|nr:HAD family hydrolase [Acidimicrobiales bacterium]
MPLALFDLDNTLVDRTAAYREWARWFAQRHQLDPPTLMAWFLDTDADGTTALAQTLELARARFDLSASVAELVAAHDESIHRFYRLDDSVAAGLRRLRADGWRLAVVTNGRFAQERIIVATGLHRLVDGWAVSSTEGVAKPDRALFEIAALRAGARLDRAWMVGDSPGDDVVAAHHLGLTTAWIHRGRAWPLRDVHPDHTVTSVAAAITTMIGGFVSVSGPRFSDQ